MKASRPVLEAGGERRLSSPSQLLVGGITWRVALRFLGVGGPSFLYPTGILYIFLGVFVNIHLVIYPQIFMIYGGLDRSSGRAGGPFPRPQAAR